MQYRLAPRIAIPFVIAFIPLAVNFSAFAQDDLLKRLQTEGAKGWNQLRSDWGRIECSGRFSGSSGTTEDCKIKANDQMFVCEEAKYGKDGSFQSTKASGCNSRYSFGLTKNQERSGWLLQYVSEQDLKTLTGKYHPRYIARNVGFAAVFELAWNTGGLKFPEAFSDERFSVEKVTNVDFDGSKCVRLDYSYTPAKVSIEVVRDQELPQHTSGFAIYDPSLNWAIRQSEVSHSQAQGPPLVARVTMSYQRGKGEVCFPKFAEVTIHPGSKLEERDSFEVKTIERREIPESEFTLSAFGLPEPEGVMWAKPRKSRTWLWLAGAAGVSALIAIGFSRLRRRRASLEKT